MDIKEIIKSNLAFYDSIKPKSQSDQNYTVLSTINDLDTGQLLALATGTQANLKTYPNDIEDCHAESLVKRAFKRYLVDNIEKSLSEHGKLNLNSARDFINQKCPRNLMLFVSQFPCGLIKRYEGQEPVDPETGQVIKRKPGRGTMIDGKVVYVQKDSCLEKLGRWMSSGLQGKRLNNIFDIKLIPSRIVIADCEPDDKLDYEDHCNRMKSHLGSEVPVEILRELAWREEFIFAPVKQPNPVSVVWWAPSSGITSESHHRGAKRSRVEAKSLEFVVDGRCRGLTKKQLSRQRPGDYLMISDYSLGLTLSRIKQSITFDPDSSSHS